MDKEDTKAHVAIITETFDYTAPVAALSAARTKVDARDLTVPARLEDVDAEADLLVTALVKDQEFLDQLSNRVRTYLWFLVVTSRGQ